MKLLEFFIDRIEREARYADISNPKDLFKIVSPSVFAIGLIVIMIVKLSVYLKILLILILFPLSLLFPYLLMMISSEKRKSEIEEVLPDALLLISANIRSGLTIEKALLVSARDEFGPLAKEIKNASLEIFGGSPVEKALNRIKERTNSEILKEVMKLMIDSVKSGGEISGLLESSARDIRKTLLLRKEINANVKMYVMFILIASIFGAPLLFAISTYLVENTWGMWKNGFNIPSVQIGSFKMSGPNISPEFFQNFAIIAIILNNLFASLIISQIKYGNIRRGIKNIAIYIAISLIVFFLVKKGVESMIGSLIS